MPAASHALTLVTRQDPVDHFLIPGRCKAETCMMESSGTGELGGTCTCRCQPHLPVFREDLQLCVDDIHECSLAPFATGSVVQKVPYVFLPLKGQIINPSSEIVLTSISNPMCVVSSAKYLSPSGWVELKNKSETYEPPFRLYRDEGRNYLQWLGGSDLRLSMEGRLILINMMCKDGSNTNNVLLNPCVAFRVSGTPSETNKWSLGVKEVSFTTEAQSGGGGGMGSGYVAVALCSLALGLGYAAGVFWYLKRKNSKEPPPPEDGHPGVVEEGVVKNNPLLRHCQEVQPPFPPNQPESGCSDSDDCSEIFHINEEMTPKPSSPANLQVTSAMIHPRCDGFECRQDELSDIDSEGTDPSNIERHPEENVSIVETHENREDRLGIVSSQTGRRKLYFNPAYFEHELLLAPPPAAIEFLTKIREVMSIAKAKMEAKRFLPSLLGIAEEKEDEYYGESVIDCISCRSNKIKCTKGAQCEGSTMSCHNNHNPSNNENKVNSIRKWLEDVPCVKPAFVGNGHSQSSGQHEYPASIASSSRGSSKGSYLSRASTIKESAKYAENLYTNHDITPDAKGTLKPVLKLKDDHVYEPNEYQLNAYEPNQYEPNIYDQNQYEPTSNEVEDSASEIDENIYMEQRYEKFSLRSCRDESMNYECITENTCKELGIGIAKSGFSTPTEYADIRPNIIEKVNCSIVFNRNSGNEYLTVGSEPVPVGDNREDHDYEMIMVESVELNETKSLPDFPNDNHSFISEVYVQHSFRDNVYPRSDSSINSNDSTNSLLSNHAQNDDQGLLTIKVEGKTVSKEEYESDYFEPDTLDRKPAKLTIHGEPPNPADVTVDFFTDSLERQPQIALKSNGSFRNNDNILAHPHLSQKNRNVTLNKAFGSLREIFVAKNRYNQCHHRPPFSGLLGTNRTLNQVSNFRWNKERYKTLKPESRQAKRQRAPSPRNINLPPIPTEVEHHEYNNISLDLDKPPPLPARKGRKSIAPLPPVPDSAPPKRDKKQTLGIRNGSVRNSIRLFNKLPELNGDDSRQLRGRPLVTAPGSNSTTEYEFMTNENRENKKPQFYLRKTNQENGSERSSSKKIYRQGHRTEDSGYLSTDSNNSYKGGRRGEREGGGSETDDSFFDGASESGAESIATDSFSFGKHFHSSTLNHYSLHDGPTENI
ncbi:hypothetical protein GE061_001553 [Apolygus lucorum]|uniref:Shavenoid isoform B-like N-terminal domain-containing protein n=1 Tax=Apolygus lucorum TaxID=248454 RepID=A0A6A4JX61_APOLU|nr:hypothetical protein GE061_001553 [Apolygus lucorum]